MLFGYFPCTVQCQNGTFTFLNTLKTNNHHKKYPNKVEIYYENNI